MTHKIVVRLVGGRADGQRVEVADMRDGFPFYAAVIAEESINAPVMMGGLGTCKVTATRHTYKLASICSDSRDFRFGIPEHWETHDALAHLFGPSHFRS